MTGMKLRYTVVILWISPAIRLPPLDLHAQDVIDTVRNETGAEIESEPRYRQLFMFPQLHRKEPPVTVTECPECGGEVQRVGGGSYFCLDCNWDNLPTLR